MGLLLPGLVIFRLGEKLASSKSNAAPVGPGARSGLETSGNVEDKTQAGRDSVGF
jgi:hypothetical protein